VRDLTTKRYEYVYAFGARLAKLEFEGNVPEGQLYYSHHDVLGSAVMQTDFDGDIVWKGDYAPFGETLEVQPVNWGNPYTFLGNEDDGGLMDFGARFYDPRIGRFYSPDPIKDTSCVNLINPYAYAANNPIKYTDRFGLAVEEPPKPVFKIEDEGGWRAANQRTGGDPGAPLDYDEGFGPDWDEKMPRQFGWGNGGTGGSQSWEEIAQQMVDAARSSGRGAFITSLDMLLHGELGTLEFYLYLREVFNDNGLALDLLVANSKSDYDRYKAEREGLYDSIFYQPAHGKIEDGKWVAQDIGGNTIEGVDGDYMAGFFDALLMDGRRGYVYNGGCYSAAMSEAASNYNYDYIGEAGKRSELVTYTFIVVQKMVIIKPIGNNIVGGFAEYYRWKSYDKSISLPWSRFVDER
jgi:RHS repeat-associated protein